MSKNNSPRELCPYIVVKGAQAAIEFYIKAFDASLNFKLLDPSDGRIGHAELSFGSTRLFIADEYLDFGAAAPETIGGSPVKLHLEVADADGFVSHAVTQGATILRPVKLEFYGQRSGLIADPFGYSWFIASPFEQVSPEEMQKRWAAMFQ